MFYQATPRTLALWSILVAFSVMGIKFVAWSMTGSVALFSDALESIVNVIASFAAWMAIRYAGQPPDDNHPFGHHKAEYFSAVLEGVLIVVAALLILHQAGSALLRPTLEAEPWAGIAVNMAAGAINGFWAWLLITRGRAARSPALIADGKHILSDVITSAGVVIGLTLAILTGYFVLDPILAIIVAVNILWQGYKIIRSSLDALMDHALEESQQQQIRKIIAEHSGRATEFHDLKTRQAGQAMFAEFHLIVDGRMTVEESHRICDRIETALREVFAGIRVTIHVEPDHKSKPGEGWRV